MKRLGFFISIVLLYVVIFGCRKNISNEPVSGGSHNTFRTATFDPTLAPGLDNEFPINLAAHVMDLQTAGSYSSNFLTHFQLPAPNSASSSATAFTTVQSQIVNASSLYAVFNSMVDVSRTEQTFFRGLRIFYGASADGDIKLVFVPLYADSVGTDTVGMKTQFALSQPTTDLNYITGDIYVCQEGSLVNISNDQMQLNMAKEWVARYRDNIQIKPTDNDPFRFQVPGAVIDANTCFFPFQEILAVIEDNGATSLNFTSIAKITQPENIYRHDIVMIPNSFYGNSPATFTNAAADMGSLCPVQCNEVAYTRSLE